MTDIDLRELARQLAPLIEQERRIKDPIKLGEAVERFLKGYKSKPSTYRAYKGVLAQFANALGSDRYIDRISRADIFDYQADLTNSGLRYASHPRRNQEARPLSDQTIRKHIKTIKSFFAYLVEIEQVDPHRNPADTFKMPPIRGAIEDQAIPTDHEIRLLLRYFWGNWSHYAMFRFIADTGCRAGEVATLLYESVDFDSLRAFIRDSKKGTPREVWISKGTARALRRCWLLRKPWKHGYFWGTAKGHMKPDNVTQMLRRACTALGIRNLHAHQFRHRKGTVMTAAQIPITDVAAVLGNTVAVAARHYINRDSTRAEAAARSTFITDEFDQAEDKTIIFPLKKAN